MHGLNDRNISKGIGATLLAAIMVSVFLVVPAKAPTISNPVFSETMDVQGGAWDGVKSYKPAGVGLDLLSGNWRANLRIGGSQAWIDPNYFPSTANVVGPSSITSTLVNLAPNPYGLPAGVITIYMTATMVNSFTTLGLRSGYVISEPWVMVETYTVRNTGPSPLTGMHFWMYYFPSPYSYYYQNPAGYISRVDYTAGIPDLFDGFIYDITLYGEGSAHAWAYTGLSTNMLPSGWYVGHGGGYPDAPYYTPSSSRPSANPTDVLRRVETNTIAPATSYDAPSGSDPNAVAGAIRWSISLLNPGDSWEITVLESVAPPSRGVGGIVVPVDKLALSAVLLASYAPLIGLALTVAVAAVATAICVRRVRRRKAKQ
jgi:hypothetical protein